MHDLQSVLGENQTRAEAPYPKWSAGGGIVVTDFSVL